MANTASAESRPVSLATWNVLATAYINPGWYPHTEARWLDPSVRLPALAESVATLGCDLLCLQEVEREAFDLLLGRLEPLGYRGDLTLKGRGKPDGCAAFWREAAFSAVSVVRLDYADGEPGQPPSGHVAQVVRLTRGGRPLAVANTHLKWDAPGTARGQRLGLRQAAQLLREREVLAPLTQHDRAAWVVCGDFNVRPGDEVLGLFAAAGLAWAEAGAPRPTSNTSGRTSVIDYIWHDAALTAWPGERDVITAETPMPGPGRPSDHLPVVADLAWAE